MSVSRCRGCGKEILWAETNHGKKIPLDPKAPVFSVVSDNGKLIAVIPSGGLIGERFYVSHFSTCIYANDFSASRKTSEPHFSEPKEPNDAA